MSETCFSIASSFVFTFCKKPKMWAAGTTFEIALQVCLATSFLYLFFEGSLLAFHWLSHLQSRLTKKRGGHVFEMYTLNSKGAPHLHLILKKRKAYGKTAYMPKKSPSDPACLWLPIDLDVDSGKVLCTILFRNIEHFAVGKSHAWLYYIQASLGAEMLWMNAWYQQKWTALAEISTVFFKLIVLFLKLIVRCFDPLNVYDRSFRRNLDIKLCYDDIEGPSCARLQ